MSGMLVAAGVAFLGVLGACVGAGALFRRLLAAPRLFLLAWTAASAALALALAALTLGFALGFDATTFRALALGGALFGPLWLAWGMVEHLAGRASVAFTARLVVAAVTVVAGVICLLDPIRGGFGTALPQISRHYMSLPATLLTFGHVISAGAAVGMLVVAAVRVRRQGDGQWPEFVVAGMAAAAVVLLIAATELPLPALVTAVAFTGAAALAWQAGERACAPRRGRGRARRSRRGGQPAPTSEEPRSKRGARPVDETRVEPIATVYEPRRRGARDRPEADQDASSRSEPPYPVPDAAVPEVTALRVSTPQPASAYGVISVYTLMEGAGEEFDQLAEKIVEEVRRTEPGTLVFACHAVPGAPLQRIFYELYRDRAAYADHERQDHVQRFLLLRKPYVMATNVIELKLMDAKITAEPGAFETLR